MATVTNHWIRLWGLWFALSCLLTASGTAAAQEKIKVGYMPIAEETPKFVAGLILGVMSKVVEMNGIANLPPVRDMMGMLATRVAMVESLVVAETAVTEQWRIGFNTTFYSYDNLSRDAKIIQVEVEPTAIGRFFPVAVGIWGNAGTVAGQLARELAAHAPDASNSWTSDFQIKRRALLEAREMEGGKQSDLIQPATLFKALRSALPKDTMFTMDAGTLCLQATDQLHYHQPPSLFTPLDFGLVGFSYACGIGVKLACPDRTVVSLMGDGGFGMTMSEIGTAVSHGINTVCVVMNNGCWGAEKAYQRDFFDGRYIGADVPNPPYDKVAELFGAVGFRVNSARDIERTLVDAVACGKPAIVDIHVDPNALYSFRRDSFKHREKSQG